MTSCDYVSIFDIQSNKEYTMKTKTEIETLVNEYDFCTYNASLIAVACLLNSMEENVENI